MASRLRAYTGRDDWRISELGVPLYLCSVDHDAIFCMYGPPDDSLQCDYPFVHIPPPQDATLLDALIAGLSTLLSTDAQMVNGAWRFDCRPSIVDAGAIVADLEAADPRPILRARPLAAVRRWPVNWFTSSFIMHSSHERNQPLLAESYLDLLGRQRELKEALAQAPRARHPRPLPPVVGHVDLPYIGSTEASTNMRQSVENRVALTARFREILDGQLDSFPFDQPANVIYGAGGFSGILGGMVATRAVDEGFARGGGEVRQIYGVSAGVLNGFFHAVQLAAARHPDLYTPAARRALDDLETFMAHCEAGKIVAVNLNPVKFWTGWANLGPLEGFLLERLAAYTGSKHPGQITFDDIALPLTVTAARTDGYTEFFGMTKPARGFEWSGRAWRDRPRPGGARPARRLEHEHLYHSDRPERPAVHGRRRDILRSGAARGLPRPGADQSAEHSPGRTRRALLQPSAPHEPGAHPLRYSTISRSPRSGGGCARLTNLLYEHFRLRAQARAAGVTLPPDFRSHWTIEHSKAIDL